MRIIRRADQRAMPWKNGGGVTTEIAVFPADAGLDDFHWRVSTARVDRDGPFSLFLGVDRSLSLLEGEGITLKVQGRVPYEMTKRCEPLVFPADVPTEATLMSGPITDLNVMTRRDRYESDVRRVEIAGKLVLEAVDEVTILIADGEGLRVATGDRTDALQQGDAVLIDVGETATLSARETAFAIAIAIAPVAARA